MTDQTPSLKKKTLKAGLAVGAAILLFKLAGLIQAIAIGHYFPDKTGDIYVFAFENCIFALFLIGEGIIAPAFLPVFMRTRNEGPDGEIRAWRFASSFLTLQTIILLCVIALLICFPESVVRLFTSWTPESQPEKFSLAAQTVKQLSPALLGLSLGSTTYVLLNAHKRFFLAAFGDAVWKFTAVLALVIFASSAPEPSSVLIIGLVAGSILKFLTHIIGLRDKISKIRPSFSIRTPEFKAFTLLALPLIAGVVFAIVRDVVNNVYFPSLLNDGLMKANSWGSKLEKVLVLLVPATLAIAVFPFFCEMAEQDNKSEFGSFVTNASRQMLTLFLPFAAVIAVLSRPIVAFVFGGGQFDAASIDRTAIAMSCYTFALPAIAVETILMKAFFASRRTVAVSILGIVFSSISMLVSWYGATFFRTRELLVLAVIAGGFAISRWLKTATLIAFFRRSAPAFPISETLFFTIRLVAASSITAVATHFTLSGVDGFISTRNLSPKLMSLIELAACGFVAIAVLAASFAVFRIREPLALLHIVRTKAIRNKNQDVQPVSDTTH